MQNILQIPSINEQRDFNLLCIWEREKHKYFKKSCGFSSNLDKRLKRTM